MTKYSGTDIYCDLIIPGKLDVEIIRETDRVLAFRHTKPHWAVHIVVIPKRHIDSLLELNQFAMTATALLGAVTDIAREVMDEYGASRIVTNLGDYQDSKHLHFHICHGDPIAQK